MPFEGVYCTDHAVYIVDKRAKAAISYRLPLNVESVTSIFCSGETILIGCSMFDYCVLQRTVYKVLQLSLRGGAKVTSYTIPTSDYLALNTPISQVWQDNKHILAVCGTGLYVFEQYPWKERSSIPVDDCAVIRLRSIIGPQHLEMPQFHAHNQRVLLTSGNHSPIWCEI